MTRRTPRAVGLLCLLLLAPPFLARTASATDRQPRAAESRGLSAMVTGEVVDERGAPVVDAEVEAVMAVPGAVPHRARTDAGGRFAFPGLHEGLTYVLRASHRGFAPESLSLTPFRTMTGYRLTLRSGVTAFGTVVDEAGRPVAGARVELVGNENGFHPYRSTSRPDGSFRISDLPAAVLELRVAHRGFPLLKQTGIEIPQQARIDLGRLALPAGKRFQGKALDPQGRPLAGARVFAVYAGDSPFLLGAGRDSGLEPEALSGPDGGFEIPRIGPEAHLFVCLPGYQPAFTYLARPPSEPGRIVLAPAPPPRPPISSRVLDEAGRPVAGARISLGNPELLAPDRTVVAPCRKAGPVEWTTDAAGRFAFDLPASGEAELWVRAPGYLREIRKLDAGQNGGIDIVLRRGATVAGRAFAADGSPVPGARVYATQEGGTAQTVTDAQGRYRLATVEPGWRELWADHPDLGEARRRLELAPGPRRLDLTLDGREEPAIMGRVVGTDGEPLAGVRIQHKLSVSTFETREDGAFRIVLPRSQVLLTDETEDLSFSREGYATLLYPFKPSALPLKGLEIRLEKGRDLTGRILGVAPEKLADVLVEASGKDDSHRTGVEPDGTYHFKNLGSGAWSVKASLHERVAQRTVELGPEGASLDLELPPLRQVRGVVLAPDGSPVSGATVRFVDRAAGASSWPSLEIEQYDGTPIWPSIQSGDDGTFSIELQEGRYEVTAIAKTYDPTPLEAPLVVETRPIDGLEIRLKPGLVLRGRILEMPEGSSASLTFTRDDHSVEAEVEPDGTYRCTGLGPGEWQVEASLDVEGVLRGRRTRVTLSSAGMPEEVFNIDLSLGDLTLAGRLTSGEEPLSAAVVLLLPDGQPLSDGVVVESSDGGAFRFARLRAGSYVLRIEDYYRDRSIQVPVDLTSDRTMTIDLLGRED